MRNKPHNILGMAYTPSLYVPIYRITIIILLSFLTACISDDTTPQPTLASVEIPASDWGAVQLIAQAEQMDAPTFLETNSGIVFTWTGSQDGEARHFSRGIRGNNQIMALSAYFPQKQQLFPIENGTLMLWLDRSDYDFDLRLQVGTFSSQGVALIGAVIISDQRTRNYDAIALDNELIRIVWSGGLGEVTNLYLHHVDDFGRPVGGDVLRIDADYPALIRDTNGETHLFWLENNGRAAYRARFNELTSSLVDIQHIATNNLAGTDAISTFNVAYDGTYAYLFWNIRRMDDRRVVLMSSGQLSDNRFSVPVPLVSNQGDAIQWAIPAAETQNPVPVVANQGEELLLVWMQNGTLQTSEWISTSGRLIGLPYITSSGNRLSVSWSQATTNGYANLFYVSRPQNP